MPAQSWTWWRSTMVPNTRFDLAGMALPASGAIREVRIIQSRAQSRPPQRAIAIGLVEMAGRKDVDVVVVMDGDGEDRPEDLSKLLAESARRRTRHFAPTGQEIGSVLFKAGHVTLPANVFGCSPGKSINFGNFSLIPFGACSAIGTHAGICGKFTGGGVRSRLPYGTRRRFGGAYAGSSKMNGSSRGSMG